MDELAALRLQIEWGADEALLDHPVDRFALIEPPPARLLAAPAPIPAAPRPLARPPPMAAAAASAHAAADLVALHAALDTSDSPLRATATHTVPPVGDPTHLVVIAEAPGADDDRSGQPFSGAPGQVLDRVLGSAGLSRERMMLSFLVPWRPPGGRPASENEIAACLPFMLRLLALTRPRHVVLMGGLPLRALAGDTGGIRRARGKWTTVTVPGAPPIPALPMLPPELWLGSATARSGTWADLIALRIALE